MKLSILFTIFLFFVFNISALEITRNELIQAPEVILEYETLGNVSQTRGDYLNAINYYHRSFELREKTGLKRTSRHALILFLSSISHYRLGNFCEAKKRAQESMEIYYYLGEIEMLHTFEKEEVIQIFNSKCE